MLSTLGRSLRLVFKDVGSILTQCVHIITPIVRAISYVTQLRVDLIVSFLLSTHQQSKSCAELKQSLSNHSSKQMGSNSGPLFFWREFEEPYGFLSQWSDVSERRDVDDGAESATIR